MRPHDPIEQAAIERSAWFARTREALGVAERAAQQLVEERQAVSEALDLLARLALIRRELDVMQHRRGGDRLPPVAPDRIDPSLWIG